MEANFNTPQRQSPVGVLVMFFDSLQGIGRALWPILLIALFKSEDHKVRIIFGIIAFIVLIGILAYLRFLNFTFYIDEEHDEFIVNDGIINKTKTTIQLNKIQQVNIHQTLIQRLIGVYAVSVDTAGSDKKEGNIKAISHALALALKAKLLDNENKVVASDSIVDAKPVISSPENHPFLKISLSSLFKVGITSNYVKSVGLILTFFFTIMENLRNIGKDEVFDEDKIGKIIDSYPVIYAILFFILLTFTIVFLINIVRTVIKYYDYSITKQKGSLLLSYGLINTDSTIVKPEKVQIVSITRNYFQKKLDVLEIKIKQAISDEKHQKKGMIEIPGCTVSERDEILKLIFKQLPEKGAMMQPNFRRLGFSIVLTIVVPLTAFFIFANKVHKEVFEFTHLALSLAFFVLVIHIFAFRNYRFFINEHHIIKQSGAWDIQNDIIEIKKIQAITTSQLFWHKNLNIGSLTLHTAGGSISFTLGKYDKIREYVNLWLYEIETSDSNWM